VHVFVIDIPPLRERPEDVLTIADHYLAKFVAAMGRKVTGFSEKSKELMLNYSWPGNVRELANAVERAMVVCREGEIQPEHLPIAADTSKTLSMESMNKLPLREIERRHIESVLKAQQFNISQAARVLGIDRVTLYNKMRRYGIER
jgi:NtrC-family two-component system response regulator AlgB